MVMSFLDIKNPSERDKIVNEYLSTMRKIQQRTQDEKALGLATRQELESNYSPITSATEKATKAITDELVPLREEIKNLKPRFPIIRKRTWDENSNLGAYDYYQQNNSGVDKYFAIREEKDQLVLGDKDVHLDGNNIIIDQREYKGSPGLWRLLMLNDPKEYSDDDYQIYQAIARATHLIDNPQRRRNGRPATTRKYTILENIHEGHGVFLPGDIKGLEQKLNLLLAEYIAGNKTTRNQIVYILDELLRRKKISKREYAEINTFLQ